MSQRKYQISCLNAALKEDGYKTSQREGLRVITPGWRYRITLDDAGCRVEPANTSLAYRTLCDRVRHHLKQMAIADGTPFIPLMQDLPWRSLVLWEPWATLVALNLKTYETRPRTIPWHNYRGILLIQAASAWKPEGIEFLRVLNEHGYRFKLTDFSPGHIVCLTHMTDCQPTHKVVATITEQDRLMSNWESERSAIELSQTRALPHPIPAKGGQGLKKISALLQEQVLESLEIDLQRVERTVEKVR